MVGDVIELKEKHLATAKEITALLKKVFHWMESRKLRSGLQEKAEAENR
jgi:uridine kinase